MFQFSLITSHVCISPEFSLSLGLKYFATGFSVPYILSIKRCSILKLSLPRSPYLCETWQYHISTIHSIKNISLYVIDRIM